MFHIPVLVQPRTDAWELNTMDTLLACRQDERCHELLRKEVIQPHLPVRLPCYDLVLIASPTFDGSLHKG